MQLLFYFFNYQTSCSHFLSLALFFFEQIHYKFVVNMFYCFHDKFVLQYSNSQGLSELSSSFRSCSSHYITISSVFFVFVFYHSLRLSLWSFLLLSPLKVFKYDPAIWIRSSTMFLNLMFWEFRCPGPSSMVFFVFFHPLRLFLSFLGSLFPKS